MQWTSNAASTAMVLCLSLSATAFAVSLDVAFEQTAVVTAGQAYDQAVVRNGGVLILDGGIIGTNASPSVTIEAGGRFIFNSGKINYFENSGITELYGGTQSTDSSVNRGYLKIAGGDPGYQIIQYEGTLDVYSTVTNRVAWEINSETKTAAPLIRFFCLSNSLAPGSYTYGTLTPTTSTPYGRVYRDHARFWTPSGSQLVAQVDLVLSSNWLGSVWSSKYNAPTPPSSSARTAIEVSWNSETGRTYQVQVTTNLLSGDWRNIGLPVHGQEAISSIFDSTSGTNKIYRVLFRH